MKIIKDQHDQKPKTIKPKHYLESEEYKRKIGLEFIAAHNEKIQKMQNNGSYDKWLNNG